MCGLGPRVNLQVCLITFRRTPGGMPLQVFWPLLHITIFPREISIHRRNVRVTFADRHASFEAGLAQPIC
jgi:hypothetical protein